MYLVNWPGVVMDGDVPVMYARESRIGILVMADQGFPRVLFLQNEKDAQPKPQNELSPCQRIAYHEPLPDAPGARCAEILNKRIRELPC